MMVLLAGSLLLTRDSWTEFLVPGLGWLRTGCCGYLELEPADTQIHTHTTTTITTTTNSFSLPHQLQIFKDPNPQI